MHHSISQELVYGSFYSSSIHVSFLLSVGEFNSEVRDSQTMYQAVLFIVSHRAIFKNRTRKVVREA